VPRNVLLEALLVVLVRSDVNEVLPPVECVLGDGGIATLVTIFSVPSVPENIRCTNDILQMGSISMQRRPRPSSFTKNQILSGIRLERVLSYHGLLYQPPTTDDRSTCNIGGIITGRGANKMLREKSAP